MPTDTYYYTDKRGICQAIFAYFFTGFFSLSHFLHFGEFPRSEPSFFGHFVELDQEKSRQKPKTSVEGIAFFGKVCYTVMDHISIP